MTDPEVKENVMKGLNILDFTTTEKDGVKCDYCGKGVFVPFYPEKKINYCFVCNHCGRYANIDP